MKISVLQEELFSKTQMVSRFVSSRAQLPVLANILLKARTGKLQMSATNLEMGISVFLGAKIEKEGEVTIPARIFADIISNLKPDKVNLEENKNHLLVSTSSFSASIAGISASEFPSVPDTVPQPSLKMEKEVISLLSKQVAFAAAMDDTRPVLTGILVMFGENITSIATDGFRLSYKEIKYKKVEGKDNKGTENGLSKLLIPARAVEELDKAIEGEDVSIATVEKDGQIILGSDQVILTSRLIEGEFPDYQRVMPGQWATQFLVDKEEFLKAVKTASVFARESASIVKINTEDGQVILTSESSQYGKEEVTVEAKTEGEGVQVAYNFKYILDFLGSVDGKDILFQTQSSTSPGVFQDAKDLSYKHIIMPVRIQS